MTTDIYATTFAAAGLKLPKRGKLDSVNLLPFLKGERKGDPHGTLYWRQGSKRGLRQGDMKIVKPHNGGWELYDLSVDLSEMNDLAESRAATLDTLVAKWEKLNAEMVDAAFK